MRYQYAIGSTLESMQYLFNLKILPPRSEFTPHSVVKMTGSGKAVGQGWATDAWDWGFISDTARTVLKSLCSGLSATVYVRTYNDSLSTPAWETYRAILLWTPQSEDRQNDNRLKFSIMFRLLEKIEE
jgi:hypothetical protein